MLWRFVPFVFLFSFILVFSIFLYSRYGIEFHDYTHIGRISDSIGFLGVVGYSIFISIINTITCSIVWYLSSKDDVQEFFIQKVAFYSISLGVISGLFVGFFSIAEKRFFNDTFLYYYLSPAVLTPNYYFSETIKFALFHIIVIFLLVAITIPLSNILLWGNRKRIEGKQRKAYQQQQTQLQAQQHQKAEQERRKREQTEQQRREAERIRKRQEAEAQAREEERQRTILQSNIQTLTGHIDTVTAKNARLTQEIRTLERIVSGLDIFDDNFLDDYPKVLQYIDEEYQIGKAV